MIEGERLVFIGGLHRSGTTLLARLLADHPDISGFEDTGASEDEGQHLQTVYPTGEVFGGPGSFAFAERARMTESLAPLDDRRRLSEQWGPHWDLSRRYLVEKSPPNLIRMRYLQSVFPASRHLLVVRNPLVSSMATQKWSGGTYDDLLQHWFHAYDIAIKDAESVKRLLAVSYESLTADAVRTLREIFGWLGLSVEGANVPRYHVGSTNATYLDRWTQEQRADPEKRAEAEALAQRHEHAMNRYGYSLLEVERFPAELSTLFPSLTTRA